MDTDGRHPAFFLYSRCLGRRADLRLYLTPTRVFLMFFERSSFPSSRTGPPPRFLTDLFSKLKSRIHLAQVDNPQRVTLPRRFLPWSHPRSNLILA